MNKGTANSSKSIDVEFVQRIEYDESVFCTQIADGISLFDVLDVDAWRNVAYRLICHQLLIRIDV